MSNVASSRRHDIERNDSSAHRANVIYRAAGPIAVCIYCETARRIDTDSNQKQIMSVVTRGRAHESRNHRFVKRRGPCYCCLRVARLRNVE